MRRSIATVCLSGTLDEKLAAAANAGFDGVEVFEVDLINSPLSPAEVRDRARALGLTIDLDALHSGLWVADVVYRPLETELLRRARELGCRTLDGGGMVVFQAADSLALFTGRRPDRDRMLAHFDELVA